MTACAPVPERVSVPVKSPSSAELKVTVSVPPFSLFTTLDVSDAGLTENTPFGSFRVAVMLPVRKRPVTLMVWLVDCSRADEKASSVWSGMIVGVAACAVPERLTVTVSAF